MKEKFTEKFKITGHMSRMLAASLVLFLCTLAFSPMSGILRTVPFLVAGGAIFFALVPSVKFLVSLSGLLTLCLHLALRGNVGEAVFFAAVSCLVSAAGAYIFRFLKAAGKTERKVVRKKCVACALGCFAVAAVLCAVVCGNVFSFASHNSENAEYIRGNYGEDVKIRYTFYDFLGGEYRTYVSFRDGENVYGNADECYVNADNKGYVDGIRNYYEERMLSGANAKLANVISGATWGYNITGSDIDFEKGEILKGTSEVEDYLDRVSYVVSFQTLFGENDRDGFVRMCEDTVSAITKSGFEFERIVLCGGDARDVLFCAEITKDTTSRDVEQIVMEFDEKLVEDIGVTKMTILDYWENK